MGAAIVVGGNLNGLGVVRSLAAAGIQSFTIDTSYSQPAMWSRFTKPVVFKSLEGRDFVDALVEFASGLPRKPLLILTYEAPVDAVADYLGDVAACCKISLPAREMVRNLADKSLFNEFAIRNHFSIPNGVSLEPGQSLEPIDTLAAPLVVKPLRPHGLADLPRAIRCDSHESARESCELFMRHGLAVIAQEWIDGADSEIYFSLFYANEQHEILAEFIGRKLASFPAHIGSTSTCVATTDHEEEIRRIVMDFVMRTEYRGFGGLELKRDARNGRFAIIEPTVGRTDMQEEIAKLAGVNLPAIAWRYEMGMPFEAAQKVNTDVAWRVSLLHGLRSKLRMDGYKVFDGYFRMNDPGPALYYYLCHLPVETARRQILG